MLFDRSNDERAACLPGATCAPGDVRARTARFALRSCRRKTTTHREIRDGLHCVRYVRACVRAVRCDTVGNRVLSRSLGSDECSHASALMRVRTARPRHWQLQQQLRHGEHGDKCRPVGEVTRTTVVVIIAATPALAG